MTSNGPCCAHLTVSWRTKDVPYDGPDGEYDPDSPHVPIKRGAMVTQGWWECDSDCGATFAPVARVLPPAPPRDWLAGCEWPTGVTPSTTTIAGTPPRDDSVLVGHHIDCAFVRAWLRSEKAECTCALARGAAQDRIESMRTLGWRFQLTDVHEDDRGREGGATFVCWFFRPGVAKGRIPGMTPPDAPITPYHRGTGATVTEAVDAAWRAAGSP